MTELHITTAEDAAWAMRKYRVLAQRKAQYAALAEAEHRRINDWLERVTMPIEGDMEFYEGHLRQWAMSQRAQGRKSIELPDGRITTRQVPASIDVDKSRFLEWAESAGRDDLVRITRAPNMAAIKSATVCEASDVLDPATGEVIPGLSPVIEHVSVNIEADLNAIDLEGLEDVE